ncbi:unnamed protein product, partial [Acidocella sp. C78]
VSESPVLSPRHALLALAVVAVWGTNFVVIRLALDQFPPFFSPGFASPWRPCRACSFCPGRG